MISIGESKNRKILNVVSYVCLSICILSGPVSAYSNVKQVLESINRARQNPTYFSILIKDEYKDKAVGNIQKEWNFRFNENPPAQFNEAIDFLNKYSESTPLELELGLTLAAWKHAKYLSTVLGSLSHTGEGGSSFTARGSVYGTYSGGGEAITYNFLEQKKGDHYIADFIIDDGVTSRGHRAIVMDKDSTKIGIGLYKGTDDRQYCVLMLASKYDCTKCNTITDQEKQDCGYSAKIFDLKIMFLVTSLMLFILVGI